MHDMTVEKDTPLDREEKHILWGLLRRAMQQTGDGEVYVAKSDRGGQGVSVMHCPDRTGTSRATKYRAAKTASAALKRQLKKKDTPLVGAMKKWAKQHKLVDMSKMCAICP